MDETPESFTGSLPADWSIGSGGNSGSQKVDWQISRQATTPLSLLPEPHISVWFMVGHIDLIEFNIINMFVD